MQKVIFLVLVLAGLGLGFFLLQSVEVETVLPADGEFAVYQRIDGYATVVIDDQTIIDVSGDDLALGYIPSDMPERAKLVRLPNGEIFLITINLHANRH